MRDCHEKVAYTQAHTLLCETILDSSLICLIPQDRTTFEVIKHVFQQDKGILCGRKRVPLSQLLANGRKTYTDKITN